MKVFSAKLHFSTNSRTFSPSKDSRYTVPDVHGVYLVPHARIMTDNILLLLVGKGHRMVRVIAW